MVSPSATSSSETVPAYGEESSTRDFAVSISQMMSLTDTVAPGATFHCTISASVRPSPTSGRLNVLSVIRVLQYAKARSSASRMRSMSGRYCSSTRATG